MVESATRKLTKPAFARQVFERFVVGMLEVLHFHSFAMGILLLTLTHLMLFVPLSPRTKAWGICTAFLAGIGDELAGWGVRFLHPGFAYAKVGFFVLLQGVLFWLMALVARALVFDQPSSYTQTGPPRSPDSL